MMGSEEIEDFLEMADRVHDAVNKIASGEADQDQKTQKEIRQLTKDLSIKDEQTKRKQSEEYRLAELKKGRPGKGQFDNYEYFCPRCHWEYSVSVSEDECGKCAGSLITKNERHHQIRIKVSELQEERKRHKNQKALYLAHMAKIKTGKVELEKGATDYRSWDFWEPDTDSDEDPILPNTPEFKAMEKDMMERSAKREMDYRIAMEFKAKGNQAFKQRNWKVALEEYTKAISARKDVKAVYTNRALVYIKLKKYSKAVKDCTTVLDIWEFLEGKKPLKCEIVVKALVRRSQALRAQRKYADALEDITMAVDMNPKQRFNRALKAEILRDFQDQRLAETALNMCTESEAGHESEDKTAADLAPQAADSHSKSNRNPVGLGSEVVASTTEPREEDGFLILDAKAATPMVAPGPSSAHTPSTSASASTISQPDKEILAQIAESIHNLSGEAVPAALRRLRELLASGAAVNLALFRKAKGFRYVAETVFGTSATCDSRRNQQNQENHTTPPHTETETETETATITDTPPTSGKRGYLHAEQAFEVLTVACQTDQNRRHAAKSKRVLKPLFELLSTIGEDAEARGAVCEGHADAAHAAICKGLGWGGEEKFRVVGAAATALCNLSHDSKTGLKMFLADRVRRGENTALEPLTSLLDTPLHLENVDEIPVRESALSALANLLGVRDLRRAYVEDAKRLKALVSMLGNAGEACRLLGGAIPPACDALFSKILGVVLNCSIETKAQPLIFEAKAVSSLVSLCKATGTSETTRTRTLLLLRRACKFLSTRKQLSKAFIAKGGVGASLASIAKDASPKSTNTIKEHVSSILAHCARDVEGRLDILSFESSSGEDGLSLLTRALAPDATAAAVANASTVISEMSVERSSLKPLGAAVGPLVAALRREGKGVEVKVMRKNAAVALAKLAKLPDNLANIRRLHGIELMYGIIAAEQ
eukprot:CAMPEP_0197515676 /NCGR_PEP_ID=MMETSP1318-20131121/732_1 /TAXON_ID=552666 /ORGANISM="Partenskyella glossopodia, Strain RCC365" /LENGTH=942 /DNA_ID=CAMNT_0043064107 /DNA_START=37 /DNA_END=2865 /DNA_ORIENTATION=-